MEISGKRINEVSECVREFINTPGILPIGDTFKSVDRRLPGFMYTLEKLDEYVINYLTISLYKEWSSVALFHKFQPC
jgi:hypothetical protein